MDVVPAFQDELQPGAGASAGRYQHTLEQSHSEADKNMTQNAES